MFLLKFFISYKKSQGYTLIELLVAVIIVGILSAIAIPSFFNQVNKARQSEAIQLNSHVLKAERGYYLENGRFTDDWAELNLGAAKKTNNYTQDLIALNADNGGIRTLLISFEPRYPALKSYVGAITINLDTNEFFVQLCEAIQPGTNQIKFEEVKVKPRKIRCPENTNSVLP